MPLAPDAHGHGHGHGHVYVSMFVRVSGRVSVALHVVHPDVIAALRLFPLAEGALPLVHRVVSWRLRPLLHTLDLLREIQGLMERERARVARATGGSGPPWAHLKAVDRVLMHDACTLYMGCASEMFGAEASWICMARPCECGANAWAVSCTPPRVSRRGRLGREALEDCVAWCWGCTRRRPVGLADLAWGWAPAATSCAYLARTHMAPQNLV